MSSLLWVTKNYQNLQEKYAGKWILICEENVIASVDTFEVAVKEYKKYHNQGKMCEIIKIEKWGCCIL